MMDGQKKDVFALQSPTVRARLEADLKRRSLEVSMNRRRLLGAMAGTASAFTLGAGLRPNLSAAAQATPAPGGEYELDANQQFFNFILENDPLSFDFNADLYVGAETEAWAGLLTFDPDGNPVPDWAESYEPNEDGSVWTFHIRPDNHGWSNGDPVTAHDFVWSFMRILSPNPPGAAAQNVYNFILFDVKNGESFSTNTPSEALDGRVATEEDLGLVALDDWTFQVTLEGPRANFPQKVAYTACVPAHRPSVEQYGERWALVEEVPLVCNGPFKVDAWEKGVKVVLSKNEGYWDAPNISITNAVDPIVPGANAVTNYLSGEGDQRLDWVTISGADLPQFQNDPDLSQQISPFNYPGIWMILPSNGVPPFDDLNVRRALSHAIDRDRLTTVTNGLTLPAYCMIPPGVFGYFEDPDIYNIQAFDPELAMSLLDETPYAGGQNWPEITILMRSDEEQYNSDLMINDIIDQLRQNLGMAVTIDQRVEANFRDELYRNTAQIVWIRWWYDYPDADNGYFDMFYGAKPSNKRQAWINDEFDRIIVEAKGVLDLDQRLELYKQAEQIIQEDVGYMPITYRVDMNAFKPWIKNIPTNQFSQLVPDGNIYVRAMTKYQISGRPAE